ncbi:hypothetical protein CY34DRAFT_710663 [Suillus luteus UH-Slu-Lm8-n1]|uniref:WD40 repeat-like protein n=1 Tax=Suillus luteus UH-Slu-Lm8-n1 TaxID=930992 RepID=A0A0D0B0C5_9AGAM|nr:hypothetical protein CY34DRAFT_710663 [Suillus luteus UH-Slu-Lm8-n1]
MSSESFISNTLEITPRQTMRGHTGQVHGVAHLPGGRHSITCSLDGLLRLWDLESGAQIGEDWRDENDVWSIALSPNGKTVASGGGDRNVRLWDVEARKVTGKWAGHSDVVCSLCWSTGGNRVASGSWDGIARVWDVDSGKTILTIKTGHEWVYAVTYSPDSSKLATGGDEENAVKIWDAKTGKLVETLEHESKVLSLAWTLDGKKLVSGSNGPIRIFDTTTWQQIATLGGHIDFVTAISLSRNNRLLASVSNDRTARLWNLDTNLPVGPLIYHGEKAPSTVLSPDAKVLVTACEDNTYTWDVHAILREAGLEDLLPIGINITLKNR